MVEKHEQLVCSGSLTWYVYRMVDIDCHMDRTKRNRSKFPRARSNPEKNTLESVLSGGVDDFVGTMYLFKNMKAT